MKFRKRENCYYLYTVNDKNKYDTIDWVIFYWGWCFDISYEICGYFDNRPRINLDLIFFSLTFVLPFRNKWTDECDCPKWGISIHSTDYFNVQILIDDAQKSIRFSEEIIKTIKNNIAQ